LDIFTFPKSQECTVWLLSIELMTVRVFNADLNVL
jgi:hypothetical protein